MSRGQPAEKAGASELRPRPVPAALGVPPARGGHSPLCTRRTVSKHRAVSKHREQMGLTGKKPVSSAGEEPGGGLEVAVSPGPREGAVRGMCRAGRGAGHRRASAQLPLDNLEHG